ncbi:hypothetical protein VKT23_016363 [Stygiomarasmius scandens]|uniref:Transposase n=1 Tax=Marasmiellus scandens TaxID=2682957 RepID=A0ABR1IYA2_9AGAR
MLFWLHTILGPPDDQLCGALMRLAVKENLKHDEILAALAKEFNYHIKERTLNNLLNKFSIPTTQRNAKNMSNGLKEFLVIEKLEHDPYHRRGPNSIKTLLQQDNTPIPRDTIRAIQRQHENPANCLLRTPSGQKLRIERKALTVLGPNQEMHSDGHEKLGPTALDMWGVGIPIYGFHQHVGHITFLQAVSDARRADIVGHLHLDMIEECGYYIPVQVTVDKGSETGEMFAQQVALHQVYSPDKFSNLDEWPAFIAVKSTRNIIGEAMWYWFRQFSGKDLADILREGKFNGYFHGHKQDHR